AIRRPVARICVLDNLVPRIAGHTGLAETTIRAGGSPRSRLATGWSGAAGEAIVHFPLRTTNLHSTFARTPLPARCTHVCAALPPSSKESVVARHRKQTTPFPGRLTAVVSGDAPRHRTESGLRGGAVAAAAAGAVLFAGYQAAVPAPAQAQPVADQRGIVTHEALKSVAVDVRTALETAAGDAR